MEEWQFAATRDEAEGGDLPTVLDKFGVLLALMDECGGLPVLPDMDILEIRGNTVGSDPCIIFMEVVQRAGVDD
jgi:hypothetical protein